jgi:hypothetical protein
MTQLSIIYFPEEGNKHSPTGLLTALCDERDIEHFIEKLETLCELGVGNWPFKWLEHFQDMYQITQGNFRLYFGIADNKIIVCHVCRKVGRKAKTKDLTRASLNLQDYRGK